MRKTGNPSRMPEFYNMWYRIAIKGEYWLTDTGPVYADGDYADDNHEMLAESHMLGALGNDIEDEGWGTQTFYNARNMFYDAVGNPMHYMGQMEDYIEALQAEYGEDDWHDYADYEGYLTWLNTHHIENEDERKIKEDWVKREIGGMKDPRTHVSKYYDWVRVQGPNIEVWEMNNLAIARIKRQISQIYHDERYDDFEEGWEDSPKFNLSILSTGKYIEGISYNDLIYGRWRERLREPEIMEIGRRRPVTNVPGYQYDGG